MCPVIPRPHVHPVARLPQGAHRLPGQPAVLDMHGIRTHQFQHRTRVHLEHLRREKRADGQVRGTAFKLGKEQVAEGGNDDLPPPVPGNQAQRSHSQ